MTSKNVQHRIFGCDTSREYDQEEKDVELVLEKTLRYHWHAMRGRGVRHSANMEICSTCLRLTPQYVQHRMISGCVDNREL
jgi:hypothetical protein